MKKEEKASFSIIKIICVSIILILISGIGVMAVNTDIKDVKIVLQNGYEMPASTLKKTVSEVLEENSIVLEENQKTIPDLDAEIIDGQVIKITDKSYTEVQIAKVSEEGVETSLEELLKNYAPITEKIIVEQVTIPYETVTKNNVGTENDTTNKVLQQGKDGLKEITSKVKYQNEVEIERKVISEVIIKEPVNKIVQVQKNIQTSRASSLPRTSTEVGSTTATVNGETYKITAYCSCSKCCGKSTGRTSSGTQATAGRTVAAPAKFAYGTKLNIGGNIYTVEDRGGAIKGNRIDIYVNSHSAALQWGVRYLPVSVVE
ncbi:MAG: G5 domain-containing protein [Clostridia bacterium]|nr:G5 domain-containing protein [Clostridia bacterium]